MIFLWASIGGFALFALNEIANPRAAFLGRVLWKGNPAGVALTFDDGPHPEHTPRILETLDRYSVRASFFVIGRHLKKHGSLAAEAARGGHGIGNHTQNHFRFMNFLPVEKIRREILECQDEAAAWAGYRPNFYRQPAGFRNPRIFGVLKNCGMSLVGWQTRAFDTQRQNAQVIAEAILKKVRPGGVILLHDGSDSLNDDRTATVQALPRIIEGIKERGLQFYTLEEMFKNVKVEV
jgi:peptidoglycan-N-acetylglucosamine deacetylase